MRPKKIEEFLGQKHITASDKLIYQAIEKDKIFSMILWGPPGCGKTTLAKIIAEQTKSNFVEFSAVLSGVKEIRAVVSQASEQIKLYRKKTVLFVDEIHRFNKAQQDAFLHHVENGLITLIGATTENPSFEVIAPLLSRCRVITLEPLSKEDLTTLIIRALKDKERGIGFLNLDIDEDALFHLIMISDGDGRAALNNLDLVANWVKSRNGKNIKLQDIEDSLQQKALRYDKDGEEHYNLISAFHKSLRGSDPHAALYWLVRMLSSGEDPMYIARRMVRFASEDVGNADPNALKIALSAMEAFRFLGHPEGDLSLAQSALYLATAPKSNSVYTAYNNLKEVVKNTGSLPVPLHIRNAPTKLMKEMGYGEGYKYAHDYEDAYIPQEYLPEKLKSDKYYFPKDIGYEKVIKERLKIWESQLPRSQGVKHES
ncbi:MAG: replication-associated recombination protein A [Desulfobacterales bacterium]|nr:replication-associated recombination protein A [Desulfobacterales bacterium]